MRDEFLEKYPSMREGFKYFYPSMRDFSHFPFALSNIISIFANDSEKGITT